MRKSNNKLVIIICSIVIAISFILIAIVVLQSFFRTTRTLNAAKAQNIVMDAKVASNLVQNDVMMNGMNQSKYNLNDIDRLGSELGNETNYSEKYEKFVIKVNYSNNTYTYSVCAIDKNENGINYTDVNDLNYQTSLEKASNVKCD